MRAEIFNSKYFVANSKENTLAFSNRNAFGRSRCYFMNVCNLFKTNHVSPSACTPKNKKVGPSLLEEPTPKYNHIYYLRKREFDAFNSPKVFSG